MYIDLTKCFECNEPMEAMHHVVPKSKGGKKMIPLCLKCHTIIHDRNFVKHRILLLEGVKKAKLLGKFKGRKLGTIESKDTILEKHNVIMNYLLNGKTVREIVLLNGNSSATIQKVRNILKEQSLI